MARTHGKSLNYTFDSVAIEGQLKEFSLEFSADESDITSFADAYQNSLAGKIDSKATFSGGYDPSVTSKAITTLHGAFGKNGVTAVVQPGGDNVGKYTITSSGVDGGKIEELNMHFGSGIRAEFSATVQHSGLMTRTAS